MSFYQKNEEIQDIRNHDFINKTILFDELKL